MIERPGRSGFRRYEPYNSYRRIPDKKICAIEILVEGQECPFCHFAELKREGNEIVCPICGYGHKACT